MLFGETAPASDGFSWSGAFTEFSKALPQVAQAIGAYKVQTAQIKAQTPVYQTIPTTPSFALPSSSGISSGTLIFLGIGAVALMLLMSKK